jgi:hypothetical protein
MTIRKNKIVSWCFAVCTGLILHYIYGFSKNLLWNRNFDFAALDGSMSKLQILLFTIGLNFVVDFTSSLIAAIICGALFVYVLQKKALFFSIPAVATFLTLSSRLWRFWKAPDLAMQISALMGPIWAGLVFASSVWLFLKILNRKRERPS